MEALRDARADRAGCAERRSREKARRGRVVSRRLESTPPARGRSAPKSSSRLERASRPAEIDTCRRDATFVAPEPAPFHRSAMPDDPTISDAEWHVLDCLWSLERATARQVTDALAAERQWTYSTVKTMLER